MIPTLGRFAWVCSTPQIPQGRKKRAGGLASLNPAAISGSHLPPQAFPPGRGRCVCSGGSSSTCSVQAQLRCWPCCTGTACRAEPSRLLPAQLDKALVPSGTPKGEAAPGAEAPRGFFPPPMGVGAQRRDMSSSSRHGGYEMMRYGGSLVGFFSCWCGWEGGAGREFGFVIPGLAAGDGGGVRMDPGVFPFLH